LILETLLIPTYVEPIDKFIKDAFIPDTLAMYEFVTYIDVDDVFVCDALILETLLIPIYVDPSDKFIKDALIPDTLAMYEFVI
jgi:hypothetical protein